MVRITIFSVVLIFMLACPAFSESLSLYPANQIISEACVVVVRADHLESSSGFDVEITWDEDIVECTSVRTGGQVTIFRLFLGDIDNSAGRLDALIVRLSKTGYTGSIDSLLVLTFDSVSDGTTRVAVTESWSDDPVLIDSLNESIDIEVSSATIKVDTESRLPPITSVRLHPNYPNPFNPGTTVMFDLPSPSSVRIRIYDANGRLVRELIDGREYDVGRWEEEWDGRNGAGNLVPSGIYFCVLEAAGKTDSRKMVVLR